MPTPKISVIVPVYKAEKYLNKCVDSLLAQTFTDFEVLLIDDGSPDCSGKICDEYARKDNRVKVFHNENGGVSSARQFGIDHAQGEYTIHADPDDWVEPNMLENLYRKAKEEDVDLVICDYYEHRGKRCDYIKQQLSSLDSRTVLKELFQQLHGSCWNKLVRRVCYDKYNIHFPEGLNYCEDLLTWIQMFQHDDIRIAYLPKAFYHYDRFVNVNSISIGNRKSMYDKIGAFYEALGLVLDRAEFSNEFLSIKFRWAFMAIVCYSLSYAQYKSKFMELRYIPNKEIKGRLSWERLCVKSALYGFYPLFKLIIEVRHLLGMVKRYILCSFG